MELHLSVKNLPFFSLIKKGLRYAMRDKLNIREVIYSMMQQNTVADFSKIIINKNKTVGTTTFSMYNV